MDLYCYPDWKLGLFGSLYFFGFGIGGIIALVGNKLNRKWMGFAGSVVLILASIVV